MDSKFSIHTKAGMLEVRECRESDYPGVSVYLNGELISTTEYNSDTDRVRTIAYTDAEDEPANITDYNRGEID